MSTMAIGGASTASNGVGSRDMLQSLDLNKFVELMIVELQNQDPLNPMDNAQILEQLTQIQAINTSTKLTQTLESVLMGQNLATASSLLDRQISALADDGSEVSGVVERVTMENGQPRVIVDGVNIQLNNIREVLPLE